MKAVLCVLVLCVAVVNAATGSSAVLAPSAALESFLESGSHTQAEIDAMAEAEVAAVMSASSESDSEADLEAAAAADVESDMPRDKKQQSRDAKRRAAMKAAAARKPVPPPKPFNPIAAAAAGVPDAADRDDLIKLVYDELKRLGGAAAMPGAPGATAPVPSPLGISDPRIATLEHRLTTFEKKRTEQANKAQDSAISSITARLEGLDKTLAQLRKSSEQQQALSAQLLRASKAAQMKEAGSTVVDYSVSYEKATLPADFEKKVEEMLGSVKTEARKIYERYCKRAGIKPRPAVAPAAAAAGPKPAAGTPAAAVAALRDAEASPAAAPVAAGAAPAASNADAASAAPRVAAAKPKKLLFKPITTGKEPTPEGMRLSKALNDVALALPVTPAYQLSRNEQALHDVLGESSVSNKFKTPRL